MPQLLDNPFYYLENFHQVVDWVRTRYRHLLNDDEHHFIERFLAMPQPSRALLVRMVMRKGPLFRRSKLRYAEIGCTHSAMRPLVEHGWADERMPLTIEQLFGLLTKEEVVSAFRLPRAKAAMKKPELLNILKTDFDAPRFFADWCPESDDCVYQILIHPLCERLKLIFFGNCAQDWSEFTLSDLGINKYEKVDMPTASFAFRQRDDVDCYLHLHRLREHFEAGAEPDDILPDMPAVPLENEWLEGRRARLLFRIGQHYERAGRPHDALAIYSDCRYPEARIRAVRALERTGKAGEAYALAQAAERDPVSEAEKQQLLRIVPRLRRKLGLPKIALPIESAVDRMELALTQPDEPYYVEQVVAAHLSEPDGPVFYVENTLLTSLFGLLCWPAIFAPVPGAFFHPFHTGPADLYSADFYRRREPVFMACLAQLDSTEYIDTIRRHYGEKQEIQSPFVSWASLSSDLIDLALGCIPAEHLKKFFLRMLLDIKSNRTGLPDLVQFWPGKRCYRMIEVKAPNDRLQDNQVRWLDYCGAHGIPISVCYVEWIKEDSAKETA